MEKAKYVYTADSAETFLNLVETLEGDAKAAGSDLNLFSPDSPVSLLNYVVESKANEFKNKVSQDSLSKTLDRATLRNNQLRALRILGEDNPYQWFEFDSNNNAQSVIPGKPASFSVPFRADPAAIDIAVEELSQERIQFFGAPSQQHRPPGGGDFLRRSEAMRLIGKRGSTQKNHPVNIVVVDQGLHPTYVDMIGGRKTYQKVVWNTSGSPPKPTFGELPTDQRSRHLTWPQWHAHMIVRNIFSVVDRYTGGAANSIKVYDVPVIPDRVGSVWPTSMEIFRQYEAIESLINPGAQNRRWVIVNAWGVVDRLREAPLGGVTTSYLHRLNVKIANLASNKKVKIVFAAGNNGAFTTNPEAGRYDRGPNRSIWFPAGLPNVYAAAACDANGMWMGDSSQGPAGEPHTQEKPDFSLPSYFREDQDAHVINTGSSASCGILAGLFASTWAKANTNISDGKIKQNSKKRGHRGHSPRLGHGVPQFDRFR